MYFKNHLAGAKLTDADLTDADLTGAKLTRADLTGANLIHAKLTCADLTNANLTDADLTGANLIHAKLTCADLTGAKLTHADLTGADLIHAKLTCADLTGADLTGADLTGADLTRADLTCVKLTRAELTGTDLTRAGLTGTNLTGTCLDPMAIPSGAMSDRWKRYRCRDGTEWIRGWRTKRSIHIGHTVYEAGSFHEASVFSVAPTGCHPGIYLFPTKKEALERAGSAPIVEVWTRPWEIHEAGKVGGKARARWVIVGDEYRVWGQERT